MKREFLSLLLAATIGFCCVQKQEEAVTPGITIVEEKIPTAIIYGRPIYENVREVIVNTSKAYLPLSNTTIAEMLWPSFGVIVEYEEQLERGQTFRT